MENSEKFELLMQEIGPVIMAESVVLFEQNNWVVETSDNQVFWFSYHVDDNSFTISIDVGEIPQESKLEIFEFLLVFNSLSRQKKLVKTAFDKEKNSCILMVDISAESLSAQLLSGVIEGVAEQAIHWFNLLKLWPAADDKQKQVILDDASQFNPNLMKV